MAEERRKKKKKKIINYTMGGQKEDGDRHYLEVLNKSIKGNVHKLKQSMYLFPGY